MSNSPFLPEYFGPYLGEYVNVLAALEKLNVAILKAMDKTKEVGDGGSGSALWTHISNVAFIFTAEEELAAGDCSGVVRVGQCSAWVTVIKADNPSNCSIISRQMLSITAPQPRGCFPHILSPSLIFPSSHFGSTSIFSSILLVFLISCRPTAHASFTLPLSSIKVLFNLERGREKVSFSKLLFSSVKTDQRNINVILELTLTQVAELHAGLQGGILGPLN